MRIPTLLAALLCTGLGCQTKVATQETCVGEGCGEPAIASEGSGPKSATTDDPAQEDPPEADASAESPSATPTAPPGPRESPTAEECDALLDHVTKITVLDLDPETTKLATEMLAQRRPAMRVDCLEKGVRREVQCAIQAPDLDTLERCAGGKTAEPPLRTPETTPTPQECDLFENHVMEMIRAQGELADAEETRSTVRQQCDQFWTKQGIVCALRARALSKLNECQDL